MWIQLAQDRDFSLVLVDKVKNLLVPENLRLRNFSPLKMAVLSRIGSVMLCATSLLHTIAGKFL
jgi:hypothetical protein